jgi:hypothetical protein
MTRLIGVYDHDGRCVASCDVRCHEAKEPECECICGGRYHGKGGDVAMLEHTVDVEAWARKKGLTELADALRVELNEQGRLL